MSGYDRALTVFSPDGHLFQVEYAQEAVRQGTLAVAVRGAGCVVLIVERKTAQKLQDPKTLNKVFPINDSAILTFAGLNADARVLIDKVRVLSESHCMNYGEYPDIGILSLKASEIQQKYTYKGGARPFGCSLLLVGFDKTGTPRIYQTDPSGAYYEWKAAAIGRSDAQTREFLEKNFKPDLSLDEAVKVAFKAMLHVVEPNIKNMQVVIARSGSVDPDGTRNIKTFPTEEFESIIKSISEEIQIENSKTKQ